MNKIENGNRKCLKKTKIRPNSRKQVEATNGSSTQRKTHATSAGLALTMQQNSVLVEKIIDDTINPKSYK